MKAYEILVDQIITKLENWNIPWKQPWIGGVPSNYISKKEYRWFNKLVLSLNDYEDKIYLTAKQVKGLWWKIVKWSKWIKVFYFKSNLIESDDNSSKVEYLLPIIKYYTVFNVEQVEWIDIDNVKVLDTKTKLYKAQEIVTDYKDKPVIKQWSNASYSMIYDTITMPSLVRFKNNEEYFSTLFHEYIHSTWSKSRLGRFWLQDIEYFGSDSYSKEELIAELWSMFLCMKAWIINKTESNSKNYIAWWLKFIKWNKKDLITASIKADKAVDYILWR